MACFKKPWFTPSEFPRSIQHPLSRPKTHILTVPFFLLSLFLLSASYTSNSPTPNAATPFPLNHVLPHPPLTFSSSQMVSEPQSRSTFSSVTTAERTHGNSTNIESQVTRGLASCDVFDGTWVHDDAEPLYQHGSCPFLDDAFNCFKNGRSDFDYLKYRWKPHGCQIPRLNNRESEILSKFT